MPLTHWVNGIKEALYCGLLNSDGYGERQFGEVGFGEMRFHAGSQRDASKERKRIGEPDTFVIRLLDDLGVGTHVAIKVHSHGAVEGQTMVVHRMLGTDTHRPRTVRGADTVGNIDFLNARGIGAIEHIGADARCPAACVAIHKVGGK